MRATDEHDSTRRSFLIRAGRAAVAGVAAPAGLNLAAIGEAAAFRSDGYKALVCIFLAGGNDHDNTVIPYDLNSYDKYPAMRGARPIRAAGGLALARSSLASTALTPTSPLAGGRQYALHPALSEVAGLFGQGRAAVVLNVGPLIVPVTRAQYMDTDRIRYPLPPKLFSHNDQTSIWQSSKPEGATEGWGGKIGDLALASNAAPLFTCIATQGSSVLLSGSSALRYQVTFRGPVAIECIKNPVFGSTAIRDTIKTLITRSAPGMIEAEYNRVVARSITAETQLSAALSGAGLTTPFGSGTLSAQLAIVAKIIAARQALGVSRQVFMVTLGSFDHHGNLLDQHNGHMRELDAAIAAFYRATLELGVADSVTTFTASEFGRSLAMNGDGSDHGWGGHHLVVGGAVNGRTVYGTPPPVSIGNSSASDDQGHVGQGRLIPTISLDQYAASLATWFGVSHAELETILPYWKNFGEEAGHANYPRLLGILPT
jgi:uncharacterized protein (DUF1501 family)